MSEAVQPLWPLTITHIHATLRRALTQAERCRLVQQNVARLVQQPRRPPRDLDPLSPDEARALLRAVNGPAGAPSAPSRCPLVCAKAKHSGCAGPTSTSTRGR